MVDKQVLQTDVDLEKVIRAIKGVISSRIVNDEVGNISEIHVLAASNRSPKQIVRDIESSLIIQAGITVDHKKISVVQTQEEDQPDHGRPRIISIGQLNCGLEAEAKVQLSIGEKLHEGVAKGPNITSNRLRLVALATLDALESFFDGRIKFIVEDIVKISLSSKEAVNVCVSIVSPQGEEILLGSAYVKNDEREAVGKATLNAVNRKLSLLNL